MSVCRCGGARRCRMRFSHSNRNCWLVGGSRRASWFNTPCAPCRDTQSNNETTGLGPPSFVIGGSSKPPGVAGRALASSSQLLLAPFCVRVCISRRYAKLGNLARTAFVIDAIFVMPRIACGCGGLNLFVGMSALDELGRKWRLAKGWGVENRLSSFLDSKIA